MQPSPRTRRLFFALWPSDALRAQLVAATEPLIERGEGRPIPPENFHITLAFLGSVDSTQVPAVIAAAAATEGTPLHLSIERADVWRSAGILCLMPAPAPALIDFVDRLHINLLAKQVELSRQEFRPHVTIARDWRERGADSSIGPLDWRADEFVLVESEPTRDGSSYRIFDRWPLRGGKHP